MSNLGKEHWQVVKCILKYLKGTTIIGLVYHGDTSYALVGYSNYNFATNLDIKRYVIGYAFSIDNCLVSCKETLQPMVALSTTEVRYMALAKAA